MGGHLQVDLLDCPVGPNCVLIFVVDIVELFCIDFVQPPQWKEWTEFAHAGSIHEVWQYLDLQVEVGDQCG